VTTDCGGTSVITDEDVRLEWQRRAGLARVMRAAPPAERNAGVTDRTRQVLAELLEQGAQALGRPLRSALEAGCGVGRLTPVIAAEAERVVALDMTAPMLDAARATCHGLSNVEFRQGRIEDVPWDDEFDVAVSVGVLMHVLDEDNLRAACRGLAGSSRYLVLIEDDRAHLPVSRWSRLRSPEEYVALMPGAQIRHHRRVGLRRRPIDGRPPALLIPPSRKDRSC
jgi:SAM-dependent methyltransferase